jgi:peptidyl-prolyl cis-trans isomerase D
VQPAEEKKVFETIRKPGRAKGIFAGIIFGFICFTFVFIGSPQDTSLQSGGPAAIVNSTPIPAMDFLQQLEQLERRMGIDLKQFPAERREQFSMQMRQRALETLIRREVVFQSAGNAGLYVPDEQLRDVIQNYEAFQEDGRFRRERYDMYLQASGKSPKAFEDQIRKDIAVQTFQNLFVVGSVPIKGELSLLDDLKQLKFNVEVASFEKRQLEEGIKVSAKRKKEFLAEEKNLEVAKSYYQGNIAKYTNKERVKARHILVSAPKDDSEAVDKAKLKIAKIQEELKSKSFAEVAKEYSDDTGSASKGGELGFFERGRMVKEFEDAAFDGEVGKVSEPVQTQYGFHLIEAQEKQAASTTPFEDVKEDIAEALLAQGEVDGVMKELNEIAKEGNSKAIKQKLRSLDIKWEESGPFDLTQDYIPLLGQNDKLLEAALKIRSEGQIFPEVLSLDGRSYVIRLNSAERVKPEVENPELAKAQALRTISRSGEIFNRWINLQREQAKIKTNDSLVATPM